MWLNLFAAQLSFLVGLFQSQMKPVETFALSVQCDDISTSHPFSLNNPLL